MKYNVHFYMTFRTKILDVEADSQEKAIAKSINRAFEAGHTIGDMWGDFEFGEECTGALVDEQGDDDYLNSKQYDKDEVYKAEEEYEDA